MLKKAGILLLVLAALGGTSSSAVACFECGSYETWIECHDCCMGYFGECESEGGGPECSFVWAECSEGCNHLPS